MRIYLETTIPSYLAARPAKALLQAARQRATRLWWQRRDHRDELVTSQLTWDEAGMGEIEMAGKRHEYLDGLPRLTLNQEAECLVTLLMRSGLLPADADADATHIALATAYRCDILLTWNCRHIANASIQRRLRGLVELHGFVLPTICTPYELLPADETE